MNKIFVFVIIVIGFAFPAIAAPQKALKKGYVQNDVGEKCWFQQKFEDGVIYFTEKHTQDIGVITFDDPSCMSDSGLGLDTNKMMVNNLISGWYSNSDAKFKTRAYELYPTSMLQIKGLCMQSQTYENIGVALDYTVKNNSLVKVVHGSTVGGCRSE